MRALKPMQHVGAPPPAAKRSATVTRSDTPASRGAVRAPVEDHLSATLARAVAGRTTHPNPLLQRVGETKLAHQPIESEATVEAREQWIAALKELKATRKARKAEWEQALKKQAATAGGISQRTIMDHYPDALTADNDVIVALGQTTPFRGQEPMLELESVATDDGTEQYVVRHRSGAPVASIVLGTAAYTKGPPAPGGRATFFRNEKQYVADNRGIPTRRYAYVEKNVFQVMELLATGSMTGRHQMLHTALGITADIYEASESLGMEVTGGAYRRGQKLTLEQLAVLHQWKGSGQDQRGLSLTSTPRADAVYSNRGGSFRSAGGARIKIDLFKVPTNVLLLNHYGDRGVKDALGGAVNPALNTGEKYSFANSVLKNRELFLERLDPRWIASLTLHEATGDKTTNTSGAELLQMVASRLGYNDYASGFTAGSLNRPAPEGASPMFILGQEVGKEYRTGYQAGQSRFPVAQPPPQPRGGQRGGKRPPPWKPPKHYGPSFGALKTQAHDEQDRHLIYWIGWAHGGWNRQQATTLKAALT